MICINAFNGALFHFGKLKSPKIMLSSFGQELIRLYIMMEKYSLFKEEEEISGKWIKPTVKFVVLLT